VCVKSRTQAFTNIVSKTVNPKVVTKRKMAKRARDDGSPLVDNNSTETTYAKPPIPGWELVAQGAEGRVWGLMVGGRPAVAKERFAKSYRHAQVNEGSQSLA